MTHMILVKQTDENK